MNTSCKGQVKTDNTSLVSGHKMEKKAPYSSVVLPAANQTDLYFPVLKDKKVGVIANQTSVIFKPYQAHTLKSIIDRNTNESLEVYSLEWKFEKYTHIVDSLISSGIRVSKVFAPEHGFRGSAEAGEVVKDGKDISTGLPIISLYGKNKKPTPTQIEDLDIVVFDIQDVGARFYTYISTLHYVMEACAESGIPLLILDRPNPNIHYTDGPVLEPNHSSFVGMHPVPVVHGMTMGEYAQMINGEKWLKNGVQCELKIIPVKNYTRATLYSLPIKPSPNLPNDKAINLYPSTCFFEGTIISEGRGTDKQFQIFGAPFLPKETYRLIFTPLPNEGAKNPKFNGKACYGKDLRNTPRLDKLRLDWLLDAYNDTPEKETFFTSFFNTLAGNETLQKQIKSGVSEEEIRAGWQQGLQKYKEMRTPYLIYK